MGTVLSSAATISAIFEYEGVRYAHLIDLTTGYPARYVSSVAVLAHAETGGLADALSTGLFCLPEQTGRTLADRNGWAVLWMHTDKKHGPKRRLAAIKEKRAAEHSAALAVSKSMRGHTKKSRKAQRKSRQRIGARSTPFRSQSA